jgi:hypothetical protein
MGLDLNSGLCVYKAGAPSLEPYLQSVLLWLVWRWGLVNYLPSLALNCDLPKHPCALPFESCFQPFLLWLLWR